MIAIHRVSGGVAPIRIVDYANGIFVQLPSRKGAKKAIERGRILLNGEVVETGRYVQPGDEISLVEKPAELHKTYHLDLEVVYEDDHMAVVCKPAGIPVSGNRFKTVAQALPHNLKPSTCTDALRIPLPVHRLDAPTTGLLLVAKTGSAMVELGRKFADREVRKRYRAVVFGTLTLSGKIDSPVDGKPAQSICAPLCTVPSLRHGSLTLVELEPLTGRTHQLRIHMAGAGHPIVGDAQYGSDANVLKGKGLMLSAVWLTLGHPVFPEREIDLQTALPQKFTSLLEMEERRWKKFNPQTGT
ncbi:MAG: pseudouridine synthase [Cryomorphaceae bacterium]|nr:RluA family pseudouridine synthase [Flavobacteriales bacterium]